MKSAFISFFVIIIFNITFITNGIADMINLETGDYYMGTGDGDMINLETGDYYMGFD